MASLDIKLANQIALNLIYKRQVKIDNLIITKFKFLKMSFSAFKQLYSSMISSGGNVASDFCDASGKVKKIKCFVKESFPYFLVTDNHFYVPCYFTKKAVDDFKSKHSGVNITDLKSKVIEICDWSLEMAKVDSSTCFTSYAGIEIRLIVSNFKLVVGTKDKVLLTRYPVNIYRDDEMKTLFQAYHHKTLAGKVTGKDSLPDVTKKGDSIVNFAAGGKFAYNFKAGTTQAVDMVSIFKSEKGAGALKKLQDSSSAGGGAKVTSSVKKAAKPASKAKKSGVADASKMIMKKDPKKSVAKIGGKSVPKMATPGESGSARNTPGITKSNFAKMKKFLQKNKGKK